MSERNPMSFTVRELGGGTSEIEFSYRIVALRREYENVRLTIECAEARLGALSPNDRFVIALGSPDGVFETGPPMSPAEKRMPKPACRVEGDTFSSPVWE